MLESNPYELGLKPIDFENMVSPKKLAQTLRRHKYPEADVTVYSLKKLYYKLTKHTSVTAPMKELVKFAVDRIFEGHDPNTFKEREKIKAEKAVPREKVAAAMTREDYSPKKFQRSGAPWFDVYRKAESKFELTRFKKSYRTLANFCTFATEQEVREIELFSK